MTYKGLRLDNKFVYGKWYSLKPKANKFSLKQLYK